MMYRFCLIISLYMLATTGFGQQIVTLQELYNLADQQSNRIAISQMGLKAASVAVEEANNARLPSLEVSLSESFIGDATLMSRGFSTSGYTKVIVPGLGPQQVKNGRQSAPHWGNTFSIKASQVVYAGGAIKAGIRMAELGEQMAELDIARNRQEVRFLIAGLYLDLYKLNNQIAVIDQNIALSNKIIANMQSRYEQGTALRNDVTRYEVQVQNLELSKIKLCEAKNIINHQLTTMLHQPSGIIFEPDSLALATEYQALKVVAPQQHWIEAAANNHIGLKQASVATEIAEQKILLTKAESLPKIAVVAENNFFGPFTNDLIPVNANVNTWFIGIGLQYNLGSLWKNKSHVNHARIVADISRRQELLVRENLETSVHTCYSKILTSVTEVATQEKQVELAAQNYKVVKNRYQNGLALLTDMLDATNLLLAAEMSLVNARVELIYNYFTLKYQTNTL